MNINALMKQVQKVQADAAKVQAELEATVVEGSAGGGAVTIRMTGAHKIESVRISQEVAEAADREMLEDVVKAAMEDVLDRVSALTKDAMGKAMGGANLPGMPKLF
jgi:DNA-binding YbaB/EbfC family protein